MSVEFFQVHPRVAGWVIPLLSCHRQSQHTASITHTQLHYHTQIQYHTLRTYRTRPKCVSGCNRNLVHSVQSQFPQYPLGDSLKILYLPSPTANPKRVSGELENPFKVMEIFAAGHKFPKCRHNQNFLVLSNSACRGIYRVMLWYNNPYHFFTGFVEAEWSSGYPSQLDKISAGEHPMWLLCPERSYLVGCREGILFLRGSFSSHHAVVPCCWDYSSCGSGPVLLGHHAERCTCGVVCLVFSSLCPVLSLLERRSGVERPSLSTVLDSRLSSRADLQVATPVCLCIPASTV